MTNRIAIVLGMLIIGAVMLDGFLFSSEHFVFLSKKMAEMIEWLAFWH